MHARWPAGPRGILDAPNQRQADWLDMDKSISFWYTLIESAPLSDRSSIYRPIRRLVTLTIYQLIHLLLIHPLTKLFPLLVLFRVGSATDHKSHTPTTALFGSSCHSLLWEDLCELWCKDKGAKIKFCCTPRWLPEIGGKRDVSVRLIDVSLTTMARVNAKGGLWEGNKGPSTNEWNRKTQHGM